MSGPLPGTDALQELRIKIAQHVQAVQDSLEAVGSENNEMARTLANGQLPAFFRGSATVRRRKDTCDRHAVSIDKGVWGNWQGNTAAPQVRFRKSITLS